MLRPFPARAAAGALALAIALLIAFSPALRCAEAAAAAAPERPTRPHTEGLTLPSRVALQRAVDEVYWRHTVWPEAGGDAKPSFAAVMSPDATRLKVEETLRKSDALSRLWRQEITGQMLQAEIDRMARGSRHPEMLREIFNSLDNNPQLIAEALARPALVERLIRNFYANDKRLQADSSKPGFDEWWQRVRGDFSTQAAAVKGVYQLPDVETTTATAAAALADSWRPMSALPAATGTAVWTGTEMIVWGGKDSGSRYNPATDTWTPTSTINAPSSRSRHTAVWTGSEMIIWGGCNLSSNFCGEATGGRYNPATDTWTPTSTVDAPRARKEHTAVWTGSEMIIWGGCNPGYNNFCNNIGTGAGGVYNPATDTWRSIDSPSAPEGRTRHRAVWTGSEMIVWGGVGTNVTNTGGRFNPSTNTWRPTSLVNAPTPRWEHTAVWTGTEMIVWGGYDGNSQISFNTGGRYNPATDSWTATSLTNAPAPRIGHTAVWTGTEMIIWGGDLRFSLGYTNTGGRYNPATDSWTPTNQTNAPSPRANHLAVWTGSLMIVWSIADVQKSGGRYDPVSDSWTPTSTRDSSPSVYRGVWTGTEMIVWGTYPGCGSGCPSTGGRYDPALDEWRPISLVGAPRAPDRDRPVTAVWTGKEMIVWGMGQNIYGAPGEGGRYNPSTDSWTPVTKTGAPDNRFYHTAVWTGSEMIVWGGQNNQGPLLNNGGRYNPTTDTWQPLNTAGAPDARYLHTAVWTGSEMIVWGGVASGAVALNTGGRYNPSTNSWQPTTTGGAPIPRFYHTAVWTGSEMIVWGGRDGDYNNNSLIYETGGRYNPATDSWQPTSLNGAPLARFRHSAVWTGSEMIVWGGLAKTGVAQREVYTGARYDAAGDIWTPTAILRAPSARSAHIALWTGSGMIIWGGDASGYTGTATHGAIYTPATTTPTPTPTPTPTATPTPAPLRSPYGGTPSIAPGRFEAEDFDRGAEGVAYHDVTPQNEGGAYRQTGVDIYQCSGGCDRIVGWVKAGEWLEYTVQSAAAGAYTFEARVSGASAGGRFHVEVDGADVTGPLSIPNTGSPLVWATVSKSGVNLSAGQHIVRVVVEAEGSDGWAGNFDWFSFGASSQTQPAAPVRVQAEDFDQGAEGVAYHDVTVQNEGGAYRQTGVDIYKCTDSACGYLVGWIRAGEWLNYTADVAAAGTYTLNARVSNGAVGGTFHILVDGVDVTGPLQIPNTGSAFVWATVAKGGIALSAGRHAVRLVMDADGTNGWVGNFDWLELAPAGQTAPQQFAFEAEDFDDGGEGTAYHDVTAQNEGGAYRQTAVDIYQCTDGGCGHIIGWIKAGEWLRYTKEVAAAGTYTFEARVSNGAVGGSFHVEVDGVDVTGPLSIPNTGSAFVWQTVSKTGVNLSAGQHTVRVVADAEAGGWVGNFDWFRFIPQP